VPTRELFFLGEIEANSATKAKLQQGSIIGHCYHAIPGVPVFGTKSRNNGLQIGVQLKGNSLSSVDFYPGFYISGKFGSRFATTI
jgi:hypothetical protein